MPDPTTSGSAPSHRAGHAGRSSGRPNWTQPKTWTSGMRWGAGIGAVVIVLVVALVALLLSGSSPKQVKATGSTTSTSTTKTQAVSRPKPGVPKCPLTGLDAPGGKVPARPALMVKVDNYPEARPWTGIQYADIIFEEPVEGFITRLAAVFQCQEAPLVGPIRSARESDQGIADLLSRPILVHVGSINQVTNLLDASNLTNIDLRYYGNVVVNPAGRVAPYDTYMSTASGWGLVPKDTSPPAPVFQYSSTPPHAPALSALSINFSSTSDESWHYNSAAHTYALSYADTGPALVVKPNGQEAQISVTNVVVQVVRYTLGPWVENSEGGLEVMVDATGSGPLEVLRNGVFVRGTWKRASLSSPLQLISQSGSPIKLAPGTTWVDIVPSGQPVVPAP